MGSFTPLTQLSIPAHCCWLGFPRRTQRCRSSFLFDVAIPDQQRFDLWPFFSLEACSSVLFTHYKNRFPPTRVATGHGGAAGNSTN